MRIFFWRKPRTIHVSERELELIRRAEAEAAGITVEELDSQDNMPLTAMSMSVAKQDGKGLRNVISPRNGFETNLVDDVNRRFSENEINDKRK